MKRFRQILLALLLCRAMTTQVLAHGDLHEQIEDVTKRIKTSPKDALLYHKRGELHRAHAEYSEALVDYAEAEKLDPRLDVVFLSRGRTLFESEKFARSLDALNIFLSRQPGHVEAQWLRARVLARLGRRDDAEKDFRQAIASVAEPSPDQFIERANNLEQAGRKDAALSVLEDGLKRLGSLITLEMAALDLELSLKQYKAALKRIDALLEKADRKETFLVRKAEAFDQMGDKLQSQRCYSLALDAIAALPEPQRKLKSTARLEKEVRSRLSIK